MDEIADQLSVLTVGIHEKIPRDFFVVSLQRLNSLEFRIGAFLCCDPIVNSREYALTQELANRCQEGAPIGPACRKKNGLMQLCVI